MALLELKNISKKYGEKIALNISDISVNKGEIVALIGRNGAGKTTLMNIISGIIYPSTGEVFYNNSDLLKNQNLLNDFGILISAVFFDYLNTYDNLKNLLIAEGVKNKLDINNIIETTLDLVDLSSQKYKKVKTFSFGMKQRLGFAQTLLTKKKFLILDEPFVGMDPLGKKMMKDVIVKKAHEEDLGILFSSHDLNDIEEICDRVIMISEGKKIYDGTFVNEKKYVFNFEGEADYDKLKNILNFADISKNSIVVKTSDMLDKVSVTLVENNLKIKDINIKENSLYDFFEREAK